MNFKDFKRRRKFEDFYGNVTIISNKIINIWTYNSRWYINLIYFLLFSATCLGIINGESNSLEFNTLVLGIISAFTNINILLFTISILTYLLGQSIRFIIFLIKKMAT